jgi:hypothetical protein
MLLRNTHFLKSIWMANIQQVWCEVGPFNILAAYCHFREGAAVQEYVKILATLARLPRCSCGVP